MRKSVRAGSQVLCVAALTLLGASPAHAASLQQQLTASDALDGDNLGWSVAVDGDIAVVGAPNVNGARGAVYEYQRSADSWQLAAKLTASDGQPGDHLGHSVDIDGNVIVAGAPNRNVFGQANEGVVYTFARTGAFLRNETAHLYALASDQSDEVGFSVAIDGDRIATGAVGLFGGRGGVFTFPSTGGDVLNEDKKLNASDSAVGDNVGWSVAIQGDEVVAGADSADIAGHMDQGAVYTWPRTGGFAETAKLTVSNGAASANLGESVAIDSTGIVAGASGTNVGSNNYQGAAYTFARTGASLRNETATLLQTDGGTNDRFGSSIATTPDEIVVGAPLDDIGAIAEQGSVYTFARLGSSRTETAKLTVPGAADNDQLGFSVGLDGSTVVAGAPYVDGAGTYRGAADIFFDPAPPPPPATDTTPPTLDLDAASSEKIRKTIKLKATCDEACSLTLDGSVKPKGDDKSQLKPTTVQLAAGVATTIKVKLGKLKRVLKDAGKGKAKLSGVATDAAGNASAAGKAKVKLD
jgi:FG-GAP repeat